MTTREYLRTSETLRRRELRFGMVREPPAPYYSHQSVITTLTSLLVPFVRDAGVGRICVSPVDVILDDPRALIVQPDIIFVSTERANIIRNQLWGAPDMVVEVLSKGTARYDQTTKVEWYQRYGVRECWIVDPDAHRIDVLGFSRSGITRARFASGEVLQSGVLTGLRLSVDDVFIE